MSDEAHMGRYWDERAREDAFFFVDDRLEYGRADEERFWQGGEEVLAAMLASFGLELKGNEAVVEIGCGIGRITRAIARRAAHVEALDVSAEMLELARSHNVGLSGVEWRLGDGHTLAGIGDASADACISYVTFQHIPDPAVTYGYVSEVGRVLRPGGFAVLHVSNDPTVHRRRIGLISHLLAFTGRGPRGRADPAWLGSAVELGALRDVASAAGMTLADSVYEGTQFCLVHLVRRSA